MERELSFVTTALGWVSSILSAGLLCSFFGWCAWEVVTTDIASKRFALSLPLVVLFPVALWIYTVLWRVNVSKTLE